MDWWLGFLSLLCAVFFLLMILGWWAFFKVRDFATEYGKIIKDVGHVIDMLELVHKDFAVTLQYLENLEDQLEGIIEKKT